MPRWLQGIPSAVRKKDESGTFRRTSQSGAASPGPSHASSALLVQITRARAQTKPVLTNTRSQNLQTSLNTSPRTCQDLLLTRPGQGRKALHWMFSSKPPHSFAAFSVTFYQVESSLKFLLGKMARRVRICALVPQGRREAGRVRLLVINGTLKGDRT